MATTIYCFSGTGNSLEVSKKLRDYMGEGEIEHIAFYEKAKIIKCETERIVIVCPVYFYELPDIVRRFATKLDIPKNTHVSAIITSGGDAGYTLYQLSQLLEDRGHKLSLGYEVPLGDNSIVLKTNPEVYSQRLKSSEMLLKLIADEIVAKKIVDIENAYTMKNRAYSQVMKLAFKNIYKANSKSSNVNTCDCCGICEKVCPASCITMCDGKPVFPGKCEQCFACINWCPKESIRFGKIKVAGNQYRYPEAKLIEIINQKNEKRIIT